jgi:RNA polymerase sigma factor (sigma-70 family)
VCQIGHRRRQHGAEGIKDITETPQAGTPADGSPSAPPIRVFILDDHELLRRGLRDCLLDAGGFEVVGESASAREAARRIPALRPHVALLDVLLPDGSGIDVCRQVRARDTTIKALMVTTYDDEQARLAAAMAGASGFVIKQIRGFDLVDAIRRVAAGETLQGPDASAAVIRKVRNSSQDERLARLTPQEQRILNLITDGLTNREIGERLGIGEKTVKNYVTRLLVKLGFVRRTQAAVFGAQVRGM